MRREVEALARQAGKGSALCGALRPKVTRTNYRAVIGAGLASASTESSERTKKTYSRAARRESLVPGLLLPGKVGEDPSIAIVIDVSGSVTRAMAQKFINHAMTIATQYPSVRLYLISHTSEVCWQGWLKAGGDPKAIEQASAFTGGTDFAPAYDAARKVAPQGKFDALVHFTDGYNFGAWPMPPARRLVVGLCGGDKLPMDTPMPAKVIPVTEAEE
jgi:predicted metal-dependent peptidase